MKYVTKLTVAVILACAAFTTQNAFSQCNSNVSICTPGLAGPFVFNQFTPGPPIDYATPVGCNTGNFGNPNGFGFIILHITTSGNLNLLVDGNATAGFIDVVVYNIPNGVAPCTAVMNQANEIGCNYATQPVGCTQFGNDFPCTSSLPAPFVTAGQRIMIIVHDYSTQSNNFTLRLGPTGAQTGPPNATITPIGPLCTTSLPTQLSAVDMGGTWTGPGVSPTGVFNPALAGVGTHTINYSIGSAPCSASSSTTIVVNGATVNVSANATICPGGSTSLTANSASSYTWSPTIGLNPTTGSAVMASPLVTTTYTVTGIAPSGCTATSTVTVNVSGAATVTTPTNQLHCPGATVPVTTLSGGAAGTIYNWTNNNTATGLAASGTGNLPSFTAVNNTNSAIVSTITITPVAVTGCNGTPQTFSITVKPTPVMSTLPNVNTCAGSSVPASTFASIPTGSTFSWTNSNTGIGLTGAGNGNTPVFTAVNSTTNAAAGTVSVTPTLNGCAGLPGTYTITVNTIPSMATPANITACAGSTINPPPFSGISLLGTTFNWTNSNSAIGLGISGIGNLPPFTATSAGNSPSTGIITVTPVNGGCSGVPVNYNITINPSPVIDPITDILQCVGTTIPASTFSVNPASANVSWSNSNTAIGLGASGSNNTPAFTGTNTTSGAISGTLTVNATAMGCSAVPQTYTITVGQTPSIAQPANITQCSGDQVLASNFTTNPPGATLDWTNSNSTIGLGPNGSGNSPLFTCSNTGTNPVTAMMTVTPSLGICVGTPVNFTITVNPLPTVTAANDGPVCLGQQINLSAGYSIGSTCNWTGPSGYSSNQQNPVLNNVQFNENGPYTITLTSSDGCSSTATTNVIIHNGIPPVIAQAGPFCKNDNPILLTTNVSGGTWSGTGITNPATGAFDPDQSATGLNTITYVCSSGCPTPATSEILVKEIPVVSFSSDQLTGCQPHTATLVDASVPPSASILWDFGDGTSSGQTDPHTFANDGCFTITLTSTSSNGCSNTASLTDYICVYPRANASFSADKYEHPVSYPSFQFFNTSQDATLYEWYFGDGSFSSALNPDHTYPDVPGNYEVILVANNSDNCPDTTRATVKVKDELLYFMPNAFTPDGDAYNNTFQPVFTSGFDPFSFTLLIYDRWGEVVFESHDATMGWDGTYAGELVKEGVYTWSVQFKVSDNDKKVTDIGTVTIIK